MSDYATGRIRKFLASTRRGRDARAKLYDLEAEAIKALAHPKRLLILDLLSDGKERTVGELLSDTKLTQSNLSQNLAVMRDCGLLSARKDGLHVYYRVTDSRVVDAVKLVRAFLQQHAANGRVKPEFEADADRRRHGVKLRAIAVGGSALILFLAAATHPIFVGGSLADVGSHAQAMFGAHDPGEMIRRCLEVVT